MVLDLSQDAYIDRVLKRFIVDNCSHGDAPIVKGDKLLQSYCALNDQETKAMK